MICTPKINTSVILDEDAISIYVTSLANKYALLVWVIGLD